MKTISTIKHVIVGANRTFDQVFGGDQPSVGQRIDNLLSRGHY
ncbi:hypothetical protein OKW49_008162 [Paraburkholderia youngii]